MSGVQIDGVNNKIDFDDDQDTSISSASDDTLVVEVGGTDRVSFTSTGINLTQDGDSLKFGANSEVVLTHVHDQGLKMSHDGGGDPDLILANTASASDGNQLGTIFFNGQNSNGDEHTYAFILGQARDVTDGEEDGQLVFYGNKGGSDKQFINYGANANGASPTHEVCINEGSEDIDFRVESVNHTHFLNVNANQDRLYIGNNAGTSTGQGQRIQLMGDTQQSSGMSLMCAAGDANAAAFEFLKSRNTSISSRTIVQDDDLVGRILGRADDGTDMNSAVAEIRISIDGTPGADDTPGRITFYTTPDGSASLSERLRLTSGGDFLVGTTAFAAGQTSSNITPSQIFSSRETTGSAGHMSFQNPNGGVGSITTSGSATAFNTSSDYRLKENVNYSWDATTELKKLKPAKFNFKTDSDTTVEGFLAHEVSDIVPLAVTGDKDATADKTNVVLSPLNVVIAENISKEKWEAGKLSTTDDNGNTVDPLYASDTTWSATHTEIIPQSIDQSKLVPLLVKTVQELEARIKTLEDA